MNDATSAARRGARGAATRREFLRLAGGAAVGAAVLTPLGATAQQAVAGYWQANERRIALHNLWNDEFLDAIYWREGQYDPGTLADLDYLLRDRRTEEVEDMFYGLFDQLFWLQRALTLDAPFQVISGFRSEATNRWLKRHNEGVATNSLHTLGMAIDVRIDGFASEQVWRAAVELNMGGAGFYRESNFVHLDAGPARNWVA